VRRREFITLLGGAAAAWPPAARAQPSGLPVVGILNAGSTAGATYLAGLRQGLIDAGYVEGQNVAIEYRWADGQYDRLPSLAAELVRRPVAVIVAGGLPPVFAAKAATSTIPIVFMSAGDPVQLGIVASLSRPGGNITGVSYLGVELASKRLELLLEAVPKASVIGVLENPTNPRADLEIAELQAAARTIGKQILVVNASSERDFGAAFAALVQGRAGALLVAGEPLFNIRRGQLIALAARHALPAISDFREFTAAGGLLSYGVSLADTYRLVAGQVARILKGAKPADLPVLQPTKFELVVNLRTAKTLGLTIPESFLLRADEVIE
jgi:putative tryptophan/tyrosine transport system substrate-binding protein